MQVFFSSLSELEAFTHQLRCQPNRTICQHCHQNDQWISHGYVYKHVSSNNKKVVGKRIICCRRFSRQGCGHTQQLYLDTAIPHRQHPFNVVVAFIATLIQGTSVQKAYFQAKGNNRSEPRQAWRWLNNLMRRLSYFRLHIDRQDEELVSYYCYRTHRFRILLPTLAVFLKTPNAQSQFQCALL
tara:strand:+ start:142 stop:693 length:552 start_codon:yes stop_codon:yes gene_type:complete